MHLGPKQCRMRRLGLFSSSPASLMRISMLTSNINYRRLVSIKKREEIEKKKTHLCPKRCQTRRLGPFSTALRSSYPVPHAHPPPPMLSAMWWLSYTQNRELVNKMKMKMKMKKHTKSSKCI